MTDPVLVFRDENGARLDVNYDRASLHGMHPRTGLPLQETDYLTNIGLRLLIQLFQPPPQPPRETDGGEVTHGPQD